MQKLTQKGPLLLIGGAVLTAVLVYFFFAKGAPTPASAAAPLETVAEVLNTQKDVRRKRMDSFIWYWAAKKNVVLQNDSLYAGRSSHALISLKNESVIDIRPQSLFTLSQSKGQNAVDLRYGDLVIELKNNAIIDLKSDLDLVTLQAKGMSNKIKLHKLPNEKVEIVYFSGKNPPPTLASAVPVPTPAIMPAPSTASAPSTGPTPSTALAPAAGVAATMVTGGPAPVPSAASVASLPAPPPPVPLVPLASPSAAQAPLSLQILSEKKLYQLSPDESVQLSWTSNHPMARYELTFSKSEHFDKIEATQKTAENSLALNRWPEGEYFWKIKGYDTAERIFTGPVHSFTINYTPPQLTSPEAGGVFKANAKIAWKAPSSYRLFHLQVASDNKFQNILQEGDSSELEAIVQKLGNGVYFTRVQGSLPEKNIHSLWSQVVSFSISPVPPAPVFQTAPSMGVPVSVTSNKELLQAPILVNEKIVFRAPNRQNRNPAALNAPILEWKPVLEAQRYKLQISKEQNFSKTVDYEVNKTKIAWSQYRPGKYFYRVYSVGKNNVSSPPSQTGMVSIDLESPVMDAIPNVHHKDVNVSWSEVPFAKSYLLEIDTDKNFAKPQRLSASGTKTTVNLPALGNYNLRVRAVDEENKPLTEFSGKQDLTYNLATALAKPVLSAPFDKASIFLQQESAALIWLEWKSVSGAKSYRIEMSASPDFSKILISKVTSDSRFLVKDVIPVGKIFWRVKAGTAPDASGDSEWSNQREFIIFHKKNETFIK